MPNVVAPNKPKKPKNDRPNVTDSPYVSTTNACKLCTPLGAAMAFKGVDGGVPYLHGSQGCATYMRRYIISHFREPMDIASSALGEKSAIYGGGPNLKKGIINVMQKYHPKIIGIATTCLTETIGDDVAMILREFRDEFGEELELPEIVFCNTPSYSGTHMEGWHYAVRALCDQLVTEKAPASDTINLLPGFVSVADLRYLKEIGEAFGLPFTMLPDYSDTLDGPALEDYEEIASGGTTIEQIKGMSGAKAGIEFGKLLNTMQSGGRVLEDKWGVPNHRIGMPMGIRETDAFFDILEDVAGKETPAKYKGERGRYVDAMVDGHKYVYGKKAIVYGEEDFVLGLTAFLAEIGVHPVLVATGARNNILPDEIKAVCDSLTPEPPLVRQGVDFFDIAEEAESLSPDLLIGHSKGYKYARNWNIPLVRVGFPIHDRFGGQRLLHVGYGGAQAMFDRIVNAVIEKKQNDSDQGYVYI